MIGVKNYQDEDCRTYLTNDRSAVEFLERLSDKHNVFHKEAMKKLAKYKKVASASQIEFFKTQIQYLYENLDALN